MIIHYIESIQDAIDKKHNNENINYDVYKRARNLAFESINCLVKMLNYKIKCSKNPSSCNYTKLEKYFRSTYNNIYMYVGYFVTLDKLYPDFDINTYKRDIAELTEYDINITRLNDDDIQIIINNNIIDILKKFYDEKKKLRENRYK